MEQLGELIPICLDRQGWAGLPAQRHAGSGSGNAECLLRPGRELQRLEPRRGHPGEAGEGVDGAPEPLHLLEHRGRALDEERLEARVPRLPRREQRLERHLQRGERVAQLVGEAPGHALPGCRLLGGPERARGVSEVLGHPVEGVDQHPDLAAPRRGHAGIERTARDRAHALGERLHRTGDATGKEEPCDQGQPEPERAGGQQGTEQRRPRLVHRCAPHRERQLRGPEREHAAHRAALGDAGRCGHESRPLELHPRPGEPGQPVRPGTVEHLAAHEGHRPVRRLHGPRRDEGGAQLHPVWPLHLDRDDHRGRADLHRREPGLDVSHPRREEGARAAHAGRIAEREDRQLSSLGHSRASRLPRAARRSRAAGRPTR